MVLRCDRADLVGIDEQSEHGRNLGTVIANGVQHADSAGLTAHIEPIPGDGVRIQVSDTGPGFDPASIPADRLGIRASIVARVTAVGGTATIDSGPRGTTVTIRWDGDAAW